MNFLCEVFGCSFRKGTSSLWSNSWHISQVLCKQRYTMALWWPFLIRILYKLLVHCQLFGEVIIKELFSIRSEFSFFSIQWCQSSLKVKVKSLSCVQLFVIPWTVAYQAPLSMGFSRQEYWNELPFPSPEDLPNPVIEPGSPTLQADSLLSERQENPWERDKESRIKRSSDWTLKNGRTESNILHKLCSLSTNPSPVAKWLERQGLLF